MSNAFVGVQRDDDGAPAFVVMLWVGVASTNAWKFSLNTGRGIDGVGHFPLHERDAKIREIEDKGFLDVEKHTDAEMAEKLGLPPDRVTGARAEVLRYAEQCDAAEQQMLEKTCAVL